MTETYIPPLKYYSHGPDVQIRIYQAGATYEAEVSALGDCQRLSIALTSNDLKSLNEKLQQTISTIINNKSLSFDDVTHMLAIEGDLAFKEIFGNVRWIQKLLTRHDISCIQITSENFILPWELLYVSEPDNTISIEKFWGMKYIISRIIPQNGRSGAFEPPEICYANGPIVGLLTYDNLPAVSQQEIPFFQQKDKEGKIRLIRLSALDSLPLNKLNEMSKFRNFWNNALDFAHFACHAVYGNNNPYDSYFLLHDDFCVTLADIKRHISVIAGSPLVILNACMTSNPNPLHTAHFAGAFYKLGARAVVATESEIPDVFAAKFIECLYSFLLEKREPLGRSLLMARKTFVGEQLSNKQIFGLFYALYGSPFIRLQKDSIQK